MDLSIEYEIHTLVSKMLAEMSETENRRTDCCEEVPSSARDDCLRHLSKWITRQVIERREVVRIRKL
jgi:hypothetical protein